MTTKENALETTFEQLYSKDISKYVKKLTKRWTDKRTGKEKSFSLSYLSWAYGHREMKRIDPDAKEYPTLFPLTLQSGAVIEVPYLWTPQGYFVEHTVTINGRTEKEILPVLDNSNLPITNPTAFDINTSNKRCFVKALAKHGLGLYLYVGEDLPENITLEDYGWEYHEYMDDKVIEFKQFNEKFTKEYLENMLDEAEIDKRERADVISFFKEKMKELINFINEQKKQKQQEAEKIAWGN